MADGLSCVAFVFRRWLVLLGALLAAGVACGAGLLPGAASHEHAWVVGLAGEGGPGGEGVIVHHLPGGGEVGEVRPGVRLGERPVGLAAFRNELVFVLAWAGDDGAGARPQRVLGVRSTRAIAVPGGGWQYDRHRVLPPIPLSDPAAPETDGGGDVAVVEPMRLSGFVAAGGAGPDGRLLVALLEPAGGDAVGSERRLLVLARDGWRAAALPDGIAASGRLWVVATDRTVALAQRGGGGTLRVWSLPADGLLAGTVSEESAHVTTGWQVWDASAPAGDFELLGIDGQIVLITGVQGDGKRRISLLRPGGSRPIAEVREEPGISLGVTGMGTGGSGRVVVVGFPGEDRSGRPLVWVWSLSGGLLYEGEMALVGPVSLDQLGLLVVLLVSLFGSILVFIARPGSTWDPPVNLPAGASLASPGRRLLAFVFDLVPGMFASSLLFPSGSGAGFLEPLGGIAPLLFVVGLTITHVSITEALSGRTLGKMVMGLRTIDAGGGKPSVRQAVLRTAVKVMCPPLMFFTLANPYMPGPAGFGTVVVVDDGTRADDDQGDSERGDGGGS